MPVDRAIYTFNEATVALADTTIDGYIDDFYASIDANYTPDDMSIKVDLIYTVENAGGDEQEFRMIFEWFEDTGVLNTILKNVLTGFTAGLTTMEGASSYTTVVSLIGTVTLVINSS